MDNIFLSHSYILVFLPKTLFSITLKLICITLSLVTLSGNHFSLCCKRNVILPSVTHGLSARDYKVSIHSDTKRLMMILSPSTGQELSPVVSPKYLQHMYVLLAFLHTKNCRILLHMSVIHAMKAISPRALSIN